MAPLTNEPDALRVVLNLTRRKAYYSLVSDITKYMRSQIESHHSPESSFPQSSSALSSARSPPPYTETEDAPPIPPRTNSGHSHSHHHHSQNEDPTSPEAPPQLPPRPPRQVPPSPALIRLRKAALLHFDSWRAETMGKLKEVVAKNDDQKVLDARRKRAEMLSARHRDVAAENEDLLSFGDADPSSSSGPASQQQQSQQGAGKPASPPNLARFQELYHPIPTRLATVALEDRKEVLSATLILLLSIGNYSAHSRVLVCYLASALEVSPAFLDSEETEIATTMVEAAQKAEAQNGAMSAEAEARKRRDEGQAGRFWKVGLASVAGAAIIGVTGGLAAPAVAGVLGGLMGSVGLGGLASFLGIFWMNGALVGTLFGAFGAKMTGGIVDQYAREVEDFKFLPLKEEWGSGWTKDGPEARRLRVTIGINGWLTTEDEVTKPWRVLGDESEVFALRYEMRSLLSLGSKLRALVGSAAWGAVRAEILQRTVLATLQGALWPIFLLNSASNLDNPFSLARNRSEKAGRILADALVNRVQGERPVTLVGYSLGARVIYSCLRQLAERNAFGLVDTVVLVGAPVPSSPAHWQMMRAVVAGRLFNVYSENDYILAFLYRTTSLQLGIAGLQPISDDVDGVENLDLSDEVQGHLRYPELIAQILTRCGFPDVKGGERGIERENSNDIRLRDEDWAQTGSLIDVGDGEPGKKTFGLSKLSLHEMENEKFDPTVKNVEEQKSNAIVRDARLLGSKEDGAKKQDAKAALATSAAGVSTATLSMPNLHEPSPGTEEAAPPLPARPVTTTSDVPRGLPPGYETPTSGGRDAGLDDYDYDSDAEEYGGRIVMLDNDSGGELTMVEPQSIQD